MHLGFIAWSFAQVDPGEIPDDPPPNIPSFADGTPLEDFSVKVARLYLTEKEQESRKAKFADGHDNSAPVFGRLRIKQHNGQPYSDEWWTTAFKRIHSRLRTPKERAFLYRLAHHSIYTKADELK
ncbi:hypothetical protein BGZ73_004143, partial [Actinomortierella ambigua]